MTDKQIPIDGIDVSGCINYTDELKDCSCRLTYAPFRYRFCEQNPNCYYKQLKLKEQECEELKKDLHQNFEEKDKLNLIIDRLLEASGCDINTASAEDFEDVYENMRYEKQQIDQLNSENESLKDSLKMFSSTLDWALKSQVGLYKRQIDSSVPDDWEYEEVLVLVEQYIEKIKQTLAEIKEIAEVEIECKTYEIENDCFNETRCKALNEHIDFIKQILQKISECEVEND